MTERLARAGARRVLELGREELTPRRHAQLSRLVERLDDDGRVPLDVVLDELAGAAGGHEQRLARLRQARKDIRASFARAGVAFSLEVDRGRGGSTVRRAWFVGDESIGRAINEQSARTMIGAEGAYPDDGFEPIEAVSIDRPTIAISYVEQDDLGKATAFVDRLRMALRGCGRGELADSLWFAPERRGNRARAAEHGAIAGARLVVVLWSSAWHASERIRTDILPLIDPQRFEVHGRDSLGVLFGATDKSDETINAELGLDEDGQGGLSWWRPRPTVGACLMEQRPVERDLSAERLAKKVCERLDDAVDGVETRWRRMRRWQIERLGHEFDVHGHYSSVRYEDVSARRADLERVARRGLGEQHGGGTYPLLDTLFEWACDPDAPRVHAVLGDFGSGKTFTARMLARRLLDERPDLATLYVDLRDAKPERIARSPHLDTVLEGWIDHWRGGPAASGIDLDTLKRELARGAIVIFDGFDEVSVHLERNTDRSFLTELMRVVVPRGDDEGARTPKMLLTCRSHYFPTLSEQNATLRDEARGGTSSRRSSSDIDVTGSLVLPFSVDQIRSALRRWLGDARATEALALIDSTHDLANLAERPYLLSMIRDRLGALEREAASGRPVNAVSLYRLLRDDALQRDVGKHRLVPDDKCELMARLAARLWRDGARTMSYEELRIWLYTELDSRIDWKTLYLRSQPELVLKDLHTATFIVRAGDDAFRFAHTSLLEYFVAEHLYGALERDARDEWLGVNADHEIVDFLLQAIDLSGSRETLWRRLAEWARAPFDGGATLTQLCLAQRVIDRGDTVDWPKMDLRDADLSDWTIGSDDPNATAPPERPLLRLPSARLDRARLRRSVWRGVDLREAEVDGAFAAQALFLGCRLENARLERAHEWAGAVFRGCTTTDEIVETLAAREPSIRIVTPSGHPFDLIVDKAFRWGEAGHFGSVKSCAISPSGEQVLSGSFDRTLKLWDTRSGEELRRLEGHERGVTSCAFSPSGEQVLSGSADRTLRLWDARSGEELQRFEGHEHEVRSCAFSPSGEQVLSGSDDRTLRLWDTRSGEELRRLEGHERGVTSCVFSPSGEQVLSGSADRTLRLWDARSGEELRRFEGHEHGVTSCAFSPSGEQVLSGSADRTLRLWDVRSGEELRRLEGHERGVTSCAFSPSGEQVLSGSADRTLRLWDARSGEELRRFEGHERGVTSCAFSPSGEQVLSGSDDGTLRLRDARSGEELRRFGELKFGMLSCAFSPSGKQVLSGSLDGMLRLWDARSGEELRCFRGGQLGTSGCTFSPSGEQVLSGSNDRTLRLWDVRSGEELRRFEGHESWVTSIAFSPSGEQVLSGSVDRTLRLWDARSGEELQRFEGHEHEVRSCAFSPSGEQVLSGSDDRTLRLWDVRSGEELRRLEGHERGVTSCVFSPSGEQVLSGSADRTLRLWDARNGEELRRFEGHEHGVTSCAFSPSGEQVLSGSADRTLRLWDARSGEELQRFEGHEHEVRSCAFSPSGKRVLSGALDGTIRLFALDPEQADEAPLILWHFPDGWAATIGLDDPAPRHGGAAWYRLRAFGLDENGRSVQRLLGEVCPD